MKPGFEVRAADALGQLLGALVPYVTVIDLDEAEQFSADLDRLLLLARERAGVVAILTHSRAWRGGCARRPAATFETDAEAQLARVEASALKLRGAWVNHPKLRGV